MHRTSTLVFVLTFLFARVVEAAGPSISSVSIPNAPMKVGDVVTATITVADDGGTIYTLVSGAVDNFNLNILSLSRTNSTTYTATFAIANGGTDIPAGSDIPVTNLELSDGMNTNTPFSSMISQASDPIDANLPVISSTSPAASAHVKTTAVAYTLSEAVSTGTITWTRTSGTADGNSPHTYNFTASDKTSGAHSFTISFAPNVVSGTTYTVTFNATDAAGNVAVTVTNAGVVFDTTNPNITGTGPANGSLVNNTQVSYNFSEACSAGTVTWTQTGGSADGSSPHVQALTGTELNSGAHNNVTLTNAPTLVSGAIYSISFDATDLAGNNATTVTRTGITFDNTAPVFSAVTPLDNAFVSTNAVTYTLSEDLASGTIVYTRTGGTADANSPHSHTLSAGERSAGSHSFTPSLAQALVSGTIYTITFSGSDAAGNPATAVNHTNVTFDNTNPTISTTAPATGAFVNTTMVSYTLSELCGSGTITWTRTAGSADGSSPHVQALTGAELNSGLHSNITLTNDPTLVSGAKYSVAFAVTDQAGNNSSTTTNTNVTFDNIAPSFNAVTANPSSGTAKVGDNIQVTLTEASGEAALLAGATVTVNGVNVAGSFTDLGSGMYRVTYNVSNGNADWTAGALPINITIKDAAGNSATMTAFTDSNTLAGDANIPVAPSALDLDNADDTGSSNTDNITKNTTGLTISGNAETGTTVQVFDGVTSKGTTVAAGGTWTLDISLAAGVHSITAKSTDAAGNVSAASSPLSITVDTTAPTVPSTPDLTSGTDSGTSNTDNITNSNNPTFTGTGENGSTVTLNSSILGDLSSGAVSSGNYSIGVGAIAEGTHLIKAYATDVAGNVSGFSSTLSVKIDRTAPTVVSAQFFSSSDHDTGCGTGTDEVIHLVMSEPLALADNALPTLKVSPSLVGFSTSVSSSFDDTCTGDGATVYHSSTQTIHLQSNGNNHWNSNTKVSFTSGGTNLKDAAGNELASFTNLSTSDTQPPTLASGFVFYPNGASAETIVFQVSETLNLADGASVTGLSTTPAGVASAIYTLATNTITMTSSSNGTWTDNVLISYSGGNISDGTNPMVSFSNQPIRLKGVTISSNNANGMTQKAKPGDIVTLAFTTTATLSATPIVTIDGNSATVSGGPLTYSAAWTTTGSDNTGVFPFQIAAETASDSTGVNATVDGTSITFDKTSPTFPSVTIASNNANTALAKPGDLVTVTFSVSETLFALPTATIGGKTATVVNTSGLNYTASVTTDGTYSEGVLPFNINIQDQVGNTASKSTTTNASSVTFDKTLPTVSSIVVDSGIPPLNGIGSTNGTSQSSFTYTVTFSEPVTGVNTADFALTSLGDVSPTDGFPAVSGNIFSVSPGGPATVYTVTVNGVTGMGQLRLDLVSDGSIKDAASNANTASFNTGQKYSVVIPEPSNNANTFNSTVVDATSIKLTWANPLLPLQPATNYLIRVKGPDDNDVAGVYPSVADGVYVPDDADFTNGNGAINIDASLTNYTFTTLLSGKTYDFEIIPYTLSPNNSNDNINFLTSSNPSVQGTTPVAAFGSLTVGSTSAPTTISSLSTAFGSKNFTFKVQDDGLSLGADNAKMKFTQLVISAGAENTVTNWSDVIAQAELKDITENNTVTTTTIGTNSITFSSLNTGNDKEGEIDDNELKEYEIRIRLKNPLTGSAAQTIDNQRFEFLVNATSFSYSSGSSQIEASQTVNSDPLNQNTNNTVTVSATALNFTTQPPSTAMVLTNLTTSPVLRAQDANGNTDLDYVSAVTVSNTGTIAMQGLNPLPPNSLTASAGVVSFPANFQYADKGNGTLTVSDGVITNGTSSAVTISYDNDDRITAGAFTEPAKISSLVNANPGVPVFDFNVVDDNGAGGDGSPTRISQIVIDQGTGNDISNWTQAIAGATLSDGTNTITGTINTNNITFSGISFASGNLGFVADNATKTYTLKIWLLSALGGTLPTTIDNLNFVFQATETGITLNSLSSDFTAPGTQSQNSGSTNNAADVITTQLKFTTSPASSLLVNTDISIQPPVPVVQALDANNNRDLDYTSPLTITNAGSLTMSNAPTTITNGIVTFANNFRYTQIGNGTLTADASALAANSIKPSNGVSTAVTIRVAQSTTITAGSGTEPSSISSIVNSSPGVQVFDFKLTDDAGTEDDGNPTTVTQVVITQSGTNNITTWSDAIASATLSDGTNTVAGAVGASSITFSSIPVALGQVTDNGNKTFKLNIWLKTALGGTLPETIDGLRFGFEVLAANVTTDVNGSSVIPGENQNSGTSNQVAVVATKLDYTTPPPSTASINTSFPSAVVVKARDINGNRDLGFNGTITAFSNAGSLAVTNAPTTGVSAFSSGQFTFNAAFQYTQDGDGTLSMTAAGISGTSPTVTVISSFESRFYEDPSFTYTTDIPYISYQASNIQNDANSIVIARFKLTDGDGDGVPGDVDGASTVINSITFSISNPSNIRRIALYDALGNELSGTNEQNGAATVTFSGLTITAPDDGSTTVSVRVSFNNSAPNVTDNQLIQLHVTAITLGGGSQFYNTPPGLIGGVSGGAQTPSNVNFVEVNATELDFTSPPAAIEGINRPVTEPVIKARDANGIVDLDFSFAATVQRGTPASSAGMFNAPTNFASGVLSFPGFQYTSIGDGTLTVSSNALQVVSSQVDVIHSSAVTADTGAPANTPSSGNNGITTETNLFGGSVNRVILGATFSAPYTISGQPKLQEFTVNFGNNVQGVIHNIRVYQSSDNSFSALTDSNITGSLTITSAANLTDSVRIQFNTPRDLSLGPISYFLMVDIDPVVSSATPSITPQIVRTAYNNGTMAYDQTVNHAVVSSGSVAINVIGRTYGFVDITPPILVSRIPVNGEQNHPIEGDIVLTFNELVNSLDGIISVYKLDGTFVADLPTSTATFPNTVYTFPTTYNDPLLGVQDWLESDTKYYIKIKPGNTDNSQGPLAGFVDVSGNKFAGITTTTGWTFKTSDITPPSFVAPTPQFQDITLTGGNLKVALDETGTVYYLVVNSGATAPTNAQIADPSTYSGEIASGTVSIVQPNADTYGPVYATFSNNNDYDIYLIARDDAQPVPNETPSIEMISFTATDPPGSGPILQTISTVDICQGNYQILFPPISIIERNNSDFDNNNVLQNINLALPEGFEFNTSAPNDAVTTSGADFTSASFSYVNKTVLKVSFQNDGNASRDRLTISGLEIKATGAVSTSGDIVRLGGTALTADLPDGTSFGTLNTYAVAPISFATGDPDRSTFGNNLNSVPLIPNTAPGDEGISSFSGPGVFGDTLYIQVAGIGSHTISYTHTDEVGCAATSDKVITVFDNSQAIDGLSSKYCTNESIATIPFNGKAPNYTLESITISLPQEVLDANPDTVTTAFYNNVILASLQPGPSPGDYIFDPTLYGTPENFALFTNIGGELGKGLDFTAQYRNVFDLQLVTFTQHVTIYIPPTTALGFGQQGAVVSNKYCEDLGDLFLDGSPRPSAGVSAGTFLVNGLGTYPGLLDRNDGTGTLNTQTVADNVQFVGSQTVSYTYVSLVSGCSSTSDSIIYITPKPVATFTHSLPCENIDVAFSDGSTIADPANFSITQWNWSFDDENSLQQTSTDQNPSHIFSQPATNNVQLTVTSQYGCKSAAATIPVVVGGTPQVNFNFAGISTADAITFQSQSSVSSNDSFGSLDWLFGDSQTDHETYPISTDYNTKYVSHTYSNPGHYDAKLVVTSGIGCSDTLARNVIIVPQFTLSDANAYNEDFENNDGGWQINPDTASWAWGATSKQVIKANSITGSKFWVTGLTDPYSDKEESYLYSPSFNMNALIRPMVSFNSIVQLKSGDGVVLQFSTDSLNIGDPNKNWKAVGAISSGYNWYNGQGLPSNPGGQATGNYGWTGDSNIDWMDSKHTLDTVGTKRSHVVFRFALSSINTNVNTDGFAMDNFRIGNRTRTVLLEQFTSTDGMSASADATIHSESNFVNNFNSSGVGTQLVKLNYHVAFPGQDPFNLDAPADPSARALYYNISKVPTARLDGSGDSQDPERTFSKWGQLAYDLRTLQLAQAQIDITPVTDSNGELTGVKVDVTPTINLPANTILNIALVESDISVSELSQTQQTLVKTGEGDFQDIVKKLIPAPTGIRFNSELQKGTMRSFGPYTIDPELIKLYAPANDLNIVAFLQNEATKEVYQTEVVSNVQDPPVVTGLSEAVEAGLLKIYPNPTSDELHIELPASLNQDIPFTLFDPVGRTVYNGEFVKGEHQKILSTRNLPEGLYLLNIGAHDGKTVQKKVMVMH